MFKDSDSLVQRMFKDSDSPVAGNVQVFIFTCGRECSKIQIHLCRECSKIQIHLCRECAKIQIHLWQRMFKDSDSPVPENVQRFRFTCGRECSSIHIHLWQRMFKDSDSPVQRMFKDSDSLVQRMFKDSDSPVAENVQRFRFTCARECSKIQIYLWQGMFKDSDSPVAETDSASVDFLLIQFGVSVFTYDKNKARYIAQPFNFYIFPRPMNSRHAPDKIFLCQSSSIDFLISQGFDFNKLFKEGIPYLMPMEENLLREQLQQKHAVASTSDDSFRKVAASPSLVSPPAKMSNIPIPEEYKEFIENTCQKIKEFIEDKDAEKLELDPCNAFLRKLIYQTAKTKFPTGVFLDTQTSEKKVKYIAVAKVKEDEIKRKEEEKQKAEMDELEDAVAFSKVIKLICDSGKLVVGHNMLLDVLHIIHQFICEVPEELDDYKTVVRCMFPKLLDTKLMASTQPFKDLLINTALGELYQSLAGKPFKRPNIEIPSKFPNYKKETNLLHEAGYDAYITGICFITMANYLGTFQDPVKGRVSPNSSSIQPFMN
uniref:Poly(A)-specific ribonuclease PARN n=1 Tax=Saccoglossus kowalevskii TaxID=10224 RepID=A0ABM0MZ12_SACKO